MTLSKEDRDYIVSCIKKKRGSFISKTSLSSQVFFKDKKDKGTKIYFMPAEYLSDWSPVKYRKGEYFVVVTYGVDSGLTPMMLKSTVVDRSVK